MLYELSYANLILLGATLPDYSNRNRDTKSADGQDVIDANDPNNRQRVRDFLNAVD